MAVNEVTISRGQYYRVPGDSAIRRNVANEIFYKSPTKASLMQILQKNRRVIEDDRVFEWMEQDLDPRNVTAGAISGLVVSLSDSDAALLKPGMGLRRDLTLVYKITAMSYTTGSATMTLDVVTGLSATDSLQVGAAIVEENSAEPTPQTRLPAFLKNQMFTARDSWGQSAWVETSDYYGQKPFQNRQRDSSMLQHKISLDVEAWNGKQTATQYTLNSHNIQYTDGVFAQIQTNIGTITNGVLTWEQLTIMAQQFDRLMESPKPMLFYSRAVSAIFDIVAYQKTSPNNFKSVENEYGLHVKELVLGNKSYQCVLVDHWTGNLGSHIVAIDPKYLTLRTIKDQSSKQLRWMLEDIRGRDLTGNDGTTGCLTTDMGVKLENEQGAFIIKNILSA